ncbi:MAG TPA: 3-carboxy-cis,cis-muconate cycloisomerase [Terriglobales bacterium]|nr:3-carboxy-cis,cis-muconate cycloisomerase [Terriglobales bacterium]
MRLVEALSTTEALTEIFSDDSVLAAMLKFELALARAEARLKIIPQKAAKAIASAADPALFDISALSRQASRSGTLVVPFSKALTELVSKKDPDAAGYVHWGTTSQDVSDTALVLLLKRAMQVIVQDLKQAESSLRELSEQHRKTVMIGRTLMQPATPITFGLKAAGWFGAVHRSRIRLQRACEEALVLQLGGAAGTLAALGNEGPAVAQAFSDELDLPLPDAPWHTHRDCLAALICACGVLVGSLGKIARDISLMSQNEVAEVAEPSGEGRGGSSTMPHKRNPVGSAITLAAATRVPALVASYLFGTLQEHERGVGGSQAEWPIIVDVIQSTGTAAHALSEVAQGLTVNPLRMRKNLESTDGMIFAEKATVLLGRKIGRMRAHKLLEDATRDVLTKQKSLTDALREMPEAKKYLDPATLKHLEVPEEYLGSAEWFRKRLLDYSENKSVHKKD